MRRDCFAALLAAVLWSGSIGSCGVYAHNIKRDTIKIEDIVVTGSREEVDLRHLPLSVSVVSSDIIENRHEHSLLPILTEQVASLFTTARGVMGYGVSTGASGGIKMRGIGGSPTTGVLVLIDGHPQYMGLMGHSLADSYQSMMAERVEVVRGPASVLYGSNAMGGVINILTHKLENDCVETNFDIGYGAYNSFTSEGSNYVKSGRFTSQITASYNRSDGHRENMDFEQYGGYSKFGYKISENWESFADLNLTHFNASNPGMEEKPIFDNDSRITRGMASFSLDNRYQNMSGSLKFFYNWGEHTIDEGYYLGDSPKEYLFNSNDMMMGLSLYETISFFKGNRVTAGFDYQNFGGVANNLFFDGESVSLANDYVDNFAGYLDFRQSIADILTLDAGLRLDDHSVTGTHLIPQFGASLYPISSAEVKLIASRGFRNPAIKEMYMFATQNPDLLPESLWNYEISWRQRLFGAALSYEVNLFYIEGENMIQVVPIDGVMMNVNSGEIENWGAELSVNYRFSDCLSTSANYSYLNMRYPVIAAPEHKLYVGVNYAKGEWSVATGLQYIAGLYCSISEEESVKENFALWNCRVGYILSENVRLYLKGENLLDQNYQINLGFPMAGATAFGGVEIRF